MTQEEFKWANQLHWQVKGHLIPTEWCNDHKQVKSMMDSYFKRLWGNHEANIHLEGFEAAWQKRLTDQNNSV
jgi:hypothetical protein